MAEERIRSGAAHTVRTYGRSPDFLDRVATPEGADDTAKQLELSMINGVLIEKYMEFVAPDLRQLLEIQVMEVMKRGRNQWLRSAVVIPELSVATRMHARDQLAEARPAEVARAAELLDLLPTGPTGLVREQLLARTAKRPQPPIEVRVVGDQVIETDASFVARNIAAGRNSQAGFHEFILPALVAKVISARPTTTLPEMVDIATRSVNLVLYPTRARMNSQQVVLLMSALRRSVVNEGVDVVQRAVSLDNLVFDEDSRRVGYRKLPEDFLVPVERVDDNGVTRWEKKRIGDFKRNARGIVDGEGCPARFATTPKGDSEIKQSWKSLIQQTSVLWALTLPTRQLETDDPDLKSLLGTRRPCSVDIADVPDVVVRVVQSSDDVGISIDAPQSALERLDLSVHPSDSRKLVIRPSAFASAVANDELPVITVRAPSISSVGAVNSKHVEIEGAERVLLDVPQGGFVRAQSQILSVIAKPESTVLLKTSGNTHIRLEGTLDRLPRVLLVTSARKDAVRVAGRGDLSIGQIIRGRESVYPLDKELATLMMSDSHWMARHFGGVPELLVEAQHGTPLGLRTASSSRTQLSVPLLETDSLYRDRSFSELVVEQAQVAVLEL